MTRKLLLYFALCMIVSVVIIVEVNERLKATEEVKNLKLKNIKNITELKTEKVRFNRLKYTKTENDKYYIRGYISSKYPHIPIEIVDIISVCIKKSSEKHGVNLQLIVALMEVESSYNPFAKSKVGATGLMQVMPTVWEKDLDIKSVESLYGIAYNIDIGVTILKLYITKNKGDIKAALSNYNGTNSDQFYEKVMSSVGKFESYKFQSNIGE